MSGFSDRFGDPVFAMSVIASWNSSRVHNRVVTPRASAGVVPVVRSTHPRFVQQ